MDGYERWWKKIERDFKRANDLIYMTNESYNKDKSQLKRIFKSIYFIDIMYERPELNKFIHNEFLNASLYFLIEGYYSLLRNENDSSLLLLRPAEENLIKALLLSNNLPINDKSFKLNTNTLDSNTSDSNTSLENDYFYQKCHSNISNLVKIYGSLSSLSHSVTNTSSNIFKTFSEISDKDVENSTFETWNDCLNSISFLIVIVSIPSLKNWEKKELQDYLNIGFGSNAVDSIIKNIY